MHLNTPVVFFLSIVAVWLVLQGEADVVGAVVAGPGGAGAAGANRQRAGAGQPGGGAARPQSHRNLVHHLHCFKHTPRVGPERRNRA